MCGCGNSSAVNASDALKKVRMYGLISTYLDIYMNVFVIHYMRPKGSRINIISRMSVISIETRTIQ